MSKSDNRFLMKGNEAIAEAAIKVGCKAFFGYPITPQTEIAAYMAKRMPESGGVYLQAESEIAAINMVLGAAATGKRVMTSTSSPGMSLKSETISYIAASDLPCLIVNVQRAGPGLGGIQPSQSDYFQATKAMGHGDFKVMVFSPASVQEVVNLVAKAYDLSDKYRVPSLILADGILGQIMEPVEFPEVIESTTVKKDWALTGHLNKRDPNIINTLILKPYVLEQMVVDRYERYKEIERLEVMVDTYKAEDAETLIVAFGATSRIVKTAVDEARNKGLKVGLLRPITLQPFPNKLIEEYSKRVKNILCVEMNMGQMLLDVKVAVAGRCPVEFYGRTGGCAPRPQDILEKIEDMQRGDK